MYLRQSNLDKYIAPFIFIYAFMQLSEALMWYDTKCGKLNKIGTYLAYLNLSLHLLGLGIGIYLVEKRIYALILGLLVFIYCLITIPKMICSVEKYGNMHWGFSPIFYKWIFLLICIILFYSKMKTPYKIILTGWYFLTWLYFFHKQHPISDLFDLNIPTKSGVGSLWCHTVSMSAPFIYLIQYFV
tara:strand:+ start:8115 stop:8672 length:558 start_codon:yes stop_codon:yes gene_type:complete